MTIPTAHYVVNEQGQKVSVQLSVEDWERFVPAFQQLEARSQLKEQLTDAFREVRAIRAGKETGIPFAALLNGL